MEKLGIDRQAAVKSSLWPFFKFNNRNVTDSGIVALHQAKVDVSTWFCPR